MFREMISLLIFIGVVSVCAETAQYSETSIRPPVRRVPWIPFLGSQQAPSSDSTEGPAGRPNLELVPLSSGSINSLSPSMMKGTERAQPKSLEENPEISRKTSNSTFDSSPVKFEEGNNK